MKTLRILLLVLVLLLITTTALQAGGGGGLWVARSALTSGYGASTKGDFNLRGSTGQPVVGLMSDSNYAIRTGFWFTYTYFTMVPLVLRD